MVAFPYSTILGSIMYIMLGTRPDLAHSIGMLCRFMSNPGMNHWRALCRVLGYLKLTENWGLDYNGQNAQGQLYSAINVKPDLIGFSDSDHAGCTTCKSVTGYVYIYYGAAISWKSQRQSTVATSSTEAEYIALFEAARESKWLRSLFLSIGVVLPSMPLIYGDNDGAMASAKDPMHFGKMKHMNVKWHAIREWVENEDFKIKRKDTAFMVADAYTKQVPFDKFAFCRYESGLRYIVS